MLTQTTDEALLNRLLGALPKGEYERFRPLLSPVTLPQGKLIHAAAERITDVYFLTSGTASLVMADKSGSSVAVAIIGNEGILGLPAAFGIDAAMFEVVMQTSGVGMKIKAGLLRDLLTHGGAFEAMLLRYIFALFAQISQTALCNRFHTVEQRVCRWLLVTADLARRPDRLDVTQEFLSRMLGAGRPAISAAARSLKKKGTIRNVRGCITIADYRGLESSCCECRGLIKAAYAAASTPQHKM